MPPKGVVHTDHNKVAPAAQRDYCHVLRELYIQLRELGEWEQDMIECGKLKGDERMGPHFQELRGKIGAYVTPKGFDLTDL